MLAERALKEAMGHHAQFAREKGMVHENAPVKEVERTSLMTQMRRKVRAKAMVKIAASTVHQSGGQARAEKEYRHSTNGRELILHGHNLQDL